MCPTDMTPHDTTLGTTLDKPHITPHMTPTTTLQRESPPRDDDDDDDGPRPRAPPPPRSRPPRRRPPRGPTRSAGSRTRSTTSRSASLFKSYSRPVSYSQSSSARRAARPQTPPPFRAQCNHGSERSQMSSAHAWSLRPLPARSSLLVRSGETQAARACRPAPSARTERSPDA